MPSPRRKTFTNAEWRIGARVKVINKIPHLPYHEGSFDFEGPVAGVIKRLEDLLSQYPECVIKHVTQWNDYKDDYEDLGYQVDAWRPLTDDEMEVWQSYTEKDKHNKALERERRAKEKAKLQAKQDEYDRKQFERLKKKFGEA